MIPNIAYLKKLKSLDPILNCTFMVLMDGFTKMVTII